MSGQTSAVFITANVGSIFEEPSVMLKIWTEEFLSTISKLDPKFIAVHCQEVGGKNYEHSMQHVEFFVKLLMESQELRLFDKVRVYLDEDYSSSEKFTALGSFYFIHESINDVMLYDFTSQSFTPVTDKEIHSGNIEHVTTKEKSKFPLDYFPECKWSRKGFMRTRWNLNSTIFDLVNIHLFHDASNFVAIESYPSVYSDIRRRALQYTLERFESDEHGVVPLFLFGDFNFRTDTKGVVQSLSEGLEVNKIQNEKSAKLEKIEFTLDDKIMLSLGKKEFSHTDHQQIFTADDGWLRRFDRELEVFSDTLYEFKITFSPSYPFEEDSTGDKCYMKTRCPAWCDRVLMSRSAIPLVKDETADDDKSVDYCLLGGSTCMGDHKPVYLRFILRVGSADTKEINMKMDVPDDIKTSNKVESVEKLGFSLETLVIVDKDIKKDIIDKDVSNYDRFTAVKRVNSASVVETKKEDWKNSRCNSDVTSQKTFIKTTSKIRLIASTTCLNMSLPRLTSHHSSSDEEWFEEIQEHDFDHFTLTSPQKLNFFYGGNDLTKSKKFFSKIKSNNSIIKQSKDISNDIEDNNETNKLKSDDLILCKQTDIIVKKNGCCIIQ